MRRVVSQLHRMAMTAAGAGAWSNCSTSLRFVRTSHATKLAQETEMQQAMATVTDYDCNREKLAKAQELRSLDTVMASDLTAARWLSWKGFKKKWANYTCMKKLSERRPDFNPNNLRDLYYKYKIACHCKKGAEGLKELNTLTTHTESKRIVDGAKGEAAAQHTKGSWKSLLLSSFRSTYEVEIEEFQFITAFLAPVATDDFFQLTYRAKLKERCSPKEEWQHNVEFPVFELKVGEGKKMNAPIVMAVLKKDGTRYGVNAMDPADYRRQLAGAKKWVK